MSLVLEVVLSKVCGQFCTGYVSWVQCFWWMSFFSCFPQHPASSFSLTFLKSALFWSFGKEHSKDCLQCGCENLDFLAHVTAIFLDPIPAAAIFSLCHWFYWHRNIMLIFCWDNSCISFSEFSASLNSQLSLENAEIPSSPGEWRWLLLGHWEICCVKTPLVLCENTIDAALICSCTSNTNSHPCVKVTAESVSSAVPHAPM